jgi:hypothetical protein
MPRKPLKPTFVLMVSALLLPSCGGGSPLQSSSLPSSLEETPSSSSAIEETFVPPAKEVHTKKDAREPAFSVRAKDGSLVHSYPSLFKAINETVQQQEDGAVVTRAKDPELVPLFTKRSAYSEDNPDQFYAYENGVSLDYYAPWESTYFTDAALAGDVALLHYDPSKGRCQSFHSSYALKNLNTADYPNDVNHLSLWESNHNIDAYAQVQLPLYTGVTKESYALLLSQATLSPAYEGSDKTMAFVGFTRQDSNYLASQGLVMDTTTGDWHYYEGLARQPLVQIQIEKQGVLFGSSWDEESKTFTPNLDVTLQAENLLLDMEGSPIMTNRLTITLSDGRRFVRDHHYPASTMAGTISFVAGLDIVDEADHSVLSSCPDYLNGSSFKNLLVKEASAEVLKSMRSSSYGQVMSLERGKSFNLLSQKEHSKAMYQTVLYNSSFAKLVSSSEGDAYSFDYGVPLFASTYSAKIENCNALIALLPEKANDVTLADTAKIYKAMSAYDKIPLAKEKALVKDYDRLVQDSNALAAL